MSGFSQLNPVPVAVGGTGGTTSTGSGAVVLATTPTLVTPVLGVATATSVNFGGTALDTYTAGTWTPTLIGSTSGSWVQSSPVGSYERIGRLVIARFFINSSSSSSPLGNIQIGGLPFAAANTTSDNGICQFAYQSGLTNTALYTTFSGIVAPNTSVIAVYESGSTQASQLAAVARSASTNVLIGMCTYHV